MVMSRIRFVLKSLDHRWGYNLMANEKKAMMPTNLLHIRVSIMCLTCELVMHLKHALILA